MFEMHNGQSLIPKAHQNNSARNQTE